MNVTSPWHYRRSADRLVEWGDIEGRNVALPAHYHREDQVTFVDAGRRRFAFGGQVVALGPGQTLVLPAGTVHASLAEPDGVVCRNLYLKAGAFDLCAWVASVKYAWRRDDEEEAKLVDSLARYRREAMPIVPTLELVNMDLRGGVARSALRRGQSREHFSRVFRFRHGIPPARFKGLARLNAARALLRGGAAPAEAAAQAGFADQSHLGREFRRTFGVTPAIYRAG